MHNFLCFIGSLLFFSHSLIGEFYDPLSVYLTWHDKPDSTMIISWLTNGDRLDNTLEYRPTDETEWRQSKGTEHKLPDSHKYLLYRVELTGLDPDKEYSFRTGSDAVVYKFRTMPSKLTRPVKIVVGGDMYHDGISFLEEMNHQAAKSEPDFALLGGDIAYSGNKFAFMKDESRRWLDFLVAWKRTMITKDGRLIPMIVTIGNHDVNGRYSMKPEQAHYFYLFFVPTNKTVYRHYQFGDYLSLILLDTNHTAPIEGKQTQWLRSTLQDQSQSLHKLAIYHVPAYPSVRSENNDVSVAVRKHWVPLFETFGLDIAFENHDHAYKRTHALLKGRVDPNGVMYVGDGSWGVETPRIPKSKRWYLAQSAAVRQVSLLELREDCRLLKSLTANGKIVDQLEVKVREPRS